MARISIHLLVISLFVSIQIFSQAVLFQAQSWSKSCIKECSQAQAHQILSNFYWAYQRSKNTLTAQQTWLKDFEILQQAGYFIGQTRRNPARQKSHILPTSLLHESRTQLYTALTNYETSNAYYNDMQELLLHDQAYLNLSLKNMLQTIRINSRHAIARALTDSLSNLQDHLGQTQEKISQAAHHFQGLIFLRPRSVKFLNYLWDYFPSLMFRAFITFDDQCTDLQEGCCLALASTFTFSNEVWRTIELERSALYHTYYSALYAEIQHTFPEITTLNVLIPLHHQLQESSITFPEPDYL